MGAVLFGLTYTRVFPGIAAIANYGNTILPTLWNVSPALLVIAITLLVGFLFYLIERGLQRKDRSQ